MLVALSTSRLIRTARGPNVDAVRQSALAAALIIDSPEPPPFEIRKSTWARVRVNPHVEVSARMDIGVREEARRPADRRRREIFAE